MLSPEPCLLHCPPSYSQAEIESSSRLELKCWVRMSSRAGSHAVNARAYLTTADRLDARLEAHKLPSITAEDSAGCGARGAALATAAGTPQRSVGTAEPCAGVCGRS